jgi:hypothetical protein
MLFWQLSPAQKNPAARGLDSGKRLKLTGMFKFKHADKI